MNNTLHRSFFEATQEVFELMLDLEVRESVASTNQDGCGDFTIAIGVTGDLTGDVLYIFPKNTMLQMVRILTGGMEVDEVDDFVTSAIGEISNIISGKALIALSQKDVSCDILPPQIIPSEKEICGYSMDSSTRIETQIGSLGFEIHLQSEQK